MDTPIFRWAGLAAVFLASNFVSAWADEPVRLDGYSYVRSLEGISEYVLENNGLQVLVKPDSSAPVITFMVTYRVGSRNEVTGTTGATHLLEHLMFKGTEAHNKDNGQGFDQMLEQTGAMTNATTWLDRTNYFETVPREHLDLVAQLEADRMRNLRLREEDRRPEMTVVRNEFEIGENDPAQALDKELWAAAFQAHPYHHSTIGWRSDIEKVPIGKLREFYDTFYWPDNAAVTVIGDVKTGEALEAVKRHFSPIPKSPHALPQVYTEEPEQTGPRRVWVKRPGDAAVVAIAHKMPAGTHADYAPVAVLSAILTEGKTSRGYRRLTDRNMTTSVDGSAGFNRDPSLHVLSATVVPEVKPEAVETELKAMLAEVREKGVTADEVSTAVSTLLSAMAYARDGSFATADQLNDVIAVGDWTLFVTLRDKIRAVTAADVQRVAKTYFVENRSTSGWYEPAIVEAAESGADPAAAAGEAATAKPEGGGAVPAKPAARKSPTTLKRVDAAPSELAARVQRQTVHGVEVLWCPTGVKDVVTLTGSLRAGDAHAEAAGNAMLATLCAEMLGRGTRKHDQFALAAQLEAVGASLTFATDTDTLSIDGKCLKADLPKLISVMAEELREPSFSEEEFAKVKQQLAAQMQQLNSDTNTQAGIAFSQAVFPKGHPNRSQTVAESLAALESATLAQVREFHAKHVGPAGMLLIATGDVDGAALTGEVGKALAGWSGGGGEVKAAPAPKREAAQSVSKPIEGKESVSVVLGQAGGIRFGDPGYAALNVATAALGRGFTSRLIGTVRDTEGLTYGITATVADAVFHDGAWKIRASFAPSLLEQGLASTRRELEKWHRDGLTPDELNRVKGQLAGSFSVSLETSDGLAAALLLARHAGRGPEFLDKWPRELEAVTLEQANAAIRERLNPATMVTVKAGSLPQ